MESLIKSTQVDDKDSVEDKDKNESVNSKKWPLNLNLITDFNTCLPYLNFYNPKKIKIFKSILKIGNKKEIVNQCYLKILKSGKKEMILNKTRFKSLPQFLNVLFNKDKNSFTLINKLRILFKKKYPKMYSMYFL